MENSQTNNPNLKKSATEIGLEINELQGKINELILDFYEKYENTISLEIYNEDRDREIKKTRSLVVIKPRYNYLFYVNDPSAFETKPIEVNEKEEKKYVPDDMQILSSLIRVLLPDSKKRKYTSVESLMKSGFVICWDITKDKLYSLVCGDAGSLFVKEYDDNGWTGVQICWGAFFTGEERQQPKWLEESINIDYKTKLEIAYLICGRLKYNDLSEYLSLETIIKYCKGMNPLITDDKLIVEVCNEIPFYQAFRGDDFIGLSLTL